MWHDLRSRVDEFELTLVILFCDYKRVLISQAKPEGAGNNSLWLS